MSLPCGHVKEEEEESYRIVVTSSYPPTYPITMVKVQPIFDKVLIANRGEIACRVIKTCNRLGIKTVAIHSTADEQSKHVKMADEAVCVGPPTSAQSYLVIDKVIDACLKTGAQAVHPGYGFLSENADFSAALKKHNIVFIGPDAHSIEAMGDKIESKRLAKQAGVTTIPGYIGEIVSHKQLLEVAREIGYPVMVKASGGGGGKGMRIANNDEECIEFFDMCKEEARAAFNNDKMLVEKFIENPRHIEVQVIADRHGNAVYLNERECSIQRRNQKVLEEAPSPLIDPVTRKAMGEQAVALAKAVQYVSAGTVENVVNPSRQFYFLEMNTRLQVEHPITELITGVDIVEQMLRAAAGLKLSITQDDVKIHGHATEARVYAEDPMKNYFPSIGRLSQYVEPHGDGVRVDSGILEGSQISVYYDPLISKLCTWGKTRDESLDRMEKALDEYVIRGLNHNVCLLRDVITQEKYRSGDITTSYLTEQYPHGFHKAPLTASEESLLLTSSCIVHAIREASAFSEKKPINTTLYAKLPVEKDEHLAVKQKVHIIQQGPKEFVVSVDDGEAKKLIVDWKREFPVVRVVESCGKVTVLQFWGTNEMLYQMQMKGTIFNTLVMTELQAKLEPIVPKIKTVVNKKEVKSPMPGVIVALSVEVGKKVVAGQELLTLEAMKMRNKIRAQHDGTIKEILVNLNATVDDGQLMILFE